MSYQNPVIVIPGITASDLHDDYPLKSETLWSMVFNKDFEKVSLHPDDLRYEAVEPSHVYPGRVFEIYNDLIKALRHELSMQADKPTPVFAFPYDWRIDIQDIARVLGDFIDEVIARTLLLKHYKGAKNELKVDLVGHSMGGLIITEYLSQYRNKSKVGKVVTIGTPYLGSIEAIVKITTGMSLLSGDVPKEREREAARATPAVYQLFPSYDKSAIFENGHQVDLFNPNNMQRSIIRSLSEYVRMYSVDTPANRREEKAEEILNSLLRIGREHRDKVNSFKPSDAGLVQDDWLAIIGVNSKTRIQMKVKNTTSGPWFIIEDEQFVDEIEKDNKSKKTGDGTVPLEGALPPFLSASKPVCVSPDDLSFFELRDKALVKVAGLHGILPAINLVQRLTIRHLRSNYRGKVWGRRVPGAGTWTPPIEGLEEKTKY